MDEQSLKKINSIEKWLFYFLCGFSFSLPVSKAVGNIFLALSLLTFFIRMFYKREDIIEKFFANKKFFYVIILFLFSIFLSALTSGFAISGLARFFERYVLHVAIIFPIVLINFERKKLLTLSALVLCGVFVSNFSVIVQALPRLSEEVWRFGGLLGIMPQGSLLAMFLPIYVLLFFHFKERRLKILAAIFVVVGTAAILFTGTRGAWLAVLILIPLVILIYSQKKLKNLGAILISLLIVGGITFFTPALSNRVATITDLKMQSNSERLLMWQSALQMFKDHPIFGVGYGHYIDAYQNEYISPLAKERTLEHAHNNFIQMLAECGAAGFATFVFMWIYFSAFALKGWKREKNIAYLIFFCLLWGIMLHGFTEYNFETSVTSKIFWYSLGICIALSKKNFWRY